jgi:hypothetical protein
MRLKFLNGKRDPSIDRKMQMGAQSGLAESEISGRAAPGLPLPDARYAGRHYLG